MISKKISSPSQCLLFFFFIIILASCNKEKHVNTISRVDNKIKIKNLIKKGEALFEKQQYDSSFFYFNKAKLLCDPKINTKDFIYSISNLATIQQNIGDYNGSENTVMEAMPIIESTNNPQFKWNIYTILGLNYLNTYDEEKALYYFNKSLELKIEPHRKFGSKNNLAYTYVQNREYLKALKIFYELKNKKYIINNKKLYGMIINNIGWVYSKTNNPLAIYYFNKSEKLNQKNNDEIQKNNNYYNIAFYYHKTNPSLSKKYLESAYQKYKNIKSTEGRYECLKLLIKLSDGSQLKKYSEEYIFLSDSLTKANQIAKNQFAKIKYDSKKEKEENLKLKEQKAENILQLELQKKRTQILYFIVGIIICLFSFIYYYLTTKSKREKIKESYQTEIKIAKKLHDELANDVYQTMTFAETQDLSTENNKEILINNLDTIYFRTRNISKENSYIETGINFIPNLKEMISDFNTETTNILINGIDSIKWNTIEKTKKIIVYRVLQELLVNMKKHSICSLVVISFKIEKNIIHLNYTDNGVGADFEQQKIKNGLQNVENRIQTIKGTITFDTKSNKGFRVNISFPK